MSQDHIPIAPKESDSNHSRWGKFSLGIAILLILGELSTMTISYFLPTDINNYTNENYLQFFNFLRSLPAWLWLLGSVGLITALTGQAVDQRKIYSIWSLCILGLCIFIVIGFTVWLIFFSPKLGS